MTIPAKDTVGYNGKVTAVVIHGVTEKSYARQLSSFKLSSALSINGSQRMVFTRLQSGLDNLIDQLGLAGEHPQQLIATCLGLVQALNQRGE